RAAGDVLPQPAERERVDAGKVIRAIGAKGVGVGGGSTQQRRGGVGRRGAGNAFVLGGTFPVLSPLVLPRSREEPEGLAALVLVGESPELLARLRVPFYPPEGDRLDLARCDVIGVERECTFDAVEGEVWSVEANERVGGG